MKKDCVCHEHAVRTDMNMLFSNILEYYLCAARYGIMYSIECPIEIAFGCSVFDKKIDFRE